MKKSIFLLFVIGLSFGASAQYLRVAKQGRVWYTYTQGNLGNSTIVLGVEGDTVINGQTYLWLVQKDSTYRPAGRRALLLEDTVAGTLEIIKTKSGVQIADTVHYDFSLDQGDTLQVKGTLSGIKDTYIADTVFTKTDFRNIARKTIRFVGATPGMICQSFTWVEGHGSMELLTVPYVPCGVIVEVGYTLSCVFDSTFQTYGDTTMICYRLSHQGEILPITGLYPNPVKNKLHIQSELPITRVRCYSIRGTLLLQAKEVETPMDVSALKPGIFILELTDADGNVGRYKVLKE